MTFTEILPGMVLGEITTISVPGIRRLAEDPELGQEGEPKIRPENLACGAIQAMVLKRRASLRPPTPILTPEK